MPRKAKLRARVAQLITELEPGGAERIVFELARGLDKNRFEQLVISLRPAVGEVARWLRESGLPVRSVEMRSKLDFGALFRLARILREERVQLLHTHLFHANFLGRLAAARAGVRAVISTVQIVERRWRPWHYLGDRLTAHLADVEICVSEAVRRATQERARIPLRKLWVIYNGVDVARFSRRFSREEMRRRLGLAQEAGVVVSVGRLRRQKGHDVVLRAMRRIVREEPGAVLLVVGGGPERTRLERLAARLELGESVRFLGQRSDVPEILAAVDVFTAGSRYEGFGLAVAEAMAAGLPVVATRVDSLPELVEDGVSGLLVPPKAPLALAEAVVHLFADRNLARSLGESARTRVAERFSLETMLRAHEALYEGVLREKGASP